MRCVALNVTDHDLGLRFWSALTGYEVLDPGYWGHGWLAYLGTTESCGHPGHPPGYKHEIILIHTDHAPIETPVPTHHQTNCVHVDITPNHGVDAAIVEILALGGRVKKPPSLYPRPTATCDEPPIIDWAVMQDPFGNEFCLVYDLTDEQGDAALDAARRGITDDRELRAVAGQTTLH
jgi:hypothetical protein